MVGILANKPDNGLNTSSANTASYQTALPWVWGRDPCALQIQQRHWKHSLKHSHTTAMPGTSSPSPQVICHERLELTHLARAACLQVTACGQVPKDQQGPHLAPVPPQKLAQLRRPSAARQPCAPALPLKTACTEGPRINVKSPIKAKKKKSTKTSKIL